MTKNKKNLDLNKRLFFIDFWKTLAIIFVIITHKYSGSDSEFTKSFPFWIDMAVPIFMITSGYTFSQSQQSKEGDPYFETLRKRLKRILPAFFLVCIIESIFLMYWEKYTIMQCFVGIVKGGWGPGSYYIIALMQLLLIFPLVFHIVKNKPIVGIISIILLNTLAHVLYNNRLLSESMFRNSIFRHLVFVGCGMLLFKYQEQFKTYVKIRRYILFPVFCLGFIYLFLISKNMYVPRVFYIWKTVAMPMVLYVGPIFAESMVFFSNRELNIRIKYIFMLIASASFHIYLVQMMYFEIVWRTSIFNQFARMPFLPVLFCILVGILFYKIENRILSVKKHNI